jgi:hypothetical protein
MLLMSNSRKLSTIPKSGRRPVVWLTATLRTDVGNGQMTAMLFCEGSEQRQTNSAGIKQSQGRANGAGMPCRWTTEALQGLLTLFGKKRCKSFRIYPARSLASVRGRL